MKIYAGEPNVEVNNDDDIDDFIANMPDADQLRNMLNPTDLIGKQCFYFVMIYFKFGKYVLKNVLFLNRECKTAK